MAGKKKEIASEKNEPKKKKRHSPSARSRKRVSYKALYETAQKRAEELQERLLRILAEFDNMKKRSERERLRLVQDANADLILKLLPVLDDLERSLTTDTSGAKLREGVELIFKKMKNTLEAEGVHPIEAEGKPFDVELHDALLQVEDASVPSGTVTEVHEKGYCLNERVLRHAKVLVSK